MGIIDNQRIMNNLGIFCGSPYCHCVASHRRSTGVRNQHILVEIWFGVHFGAWFKMDWMALITGWASNQLSPDLVRRHESVLSLWYNFIVSGISYSVLSEDHFSLPLRFIKLFPHQTSQCWLNSHRCISSNPCNMKRWRHWGRIARLRYTSRPGSW
jgi:hypothetical protein